MTGRNRASTGCREQEPAACRAWALAARQLVGPREGRVADFAGIEVVAGISSVSIPGAHACRQFVDIGFDEPPTQVHRGGVPPFPGLGLRVGV